MVAVAGTDADPSEWAAHSGHKRWRQGPVQGLQQNIPQDDQRMSEERPREKVDVYVLMKLWMIFNVQSTMVVIVWRMLEP